MPSRTCSVRLRPCAVALEHLDHPQRVLVVLEAAAAALAQRRVERLLAGVAEGRVAEVVAEPDRLGQVLVQAQRPGDGAGDPAGLQRVGEAGPVVVALGGDEDLGLVLEPAEGLRVDDAVAVALERRPQRAVGLLDARARPGRSGSRARRGTRPPRRGRGPRRWRWRAPTSIIGRRSAARRSPSASLRRRRAAARARGARASRRPPARPGAAPRGSAAGASASGCASASTMKRCASSESAKEPASQLAQTTPPAAPEKPARCSASPQRAQEASSGAKPATSASFSRKESATSSPAARGCAGSSSSAR